MNTNNPVEIYEKFIKSMPSIGFINRNKRIKAYIKVTNFAQKMIDRSEISEDEALFVLSIMAKKSNAFRKAITMTALSLETLPKGAVKSVGFKYADEMRRTLNLPSAMDELTED